MANSLPLAGELTPGTCKGVLEPGCKGVLRRCTRQTVTNACPGLPHMHSYPGYVGPLSVKGMLLVSDSSATGITVTGMLAGLPAQQSGGWHIHSGHTCEVLTAVGGHYYTAVEDPWNAVSCVRGVPRPAWHLCLASCSLTLWHIGGELVPHSPSSPCSHRYATDAFGVATISLTINNFSLYETNPVNGRALVVHDPIGGRVACGLLGPPPCTAYRCATYSCTAHRLLGGHGPSLPHVAWAAFASQDPQTWAWPR